MLSCFTTKILLYLVKTLHKFIIIINTKIELNSVLCNCCIMRIIKLECLGNEVLPRGLSNRSEIIRLNYVVIAYINIK